MNEHTFGIFEGFICKIIYLIRDLVLFIKQLLLVWVKPIKGEVNNANRLPVIGNLSACTIDDVRHLVTDYEFEILGS